MAQQNKYRDIDKNVYDLNQPYKINEKYTKPVGSISLIISFNDTTYYTTNSMRDIIIKPYAEFGDYISSHLAVFFVCKI